MPTLVFLHAHPDDESSLTAGMMSQASAAGARVVTVFATGGEHGTAPADLPEGTSVADYRRGEAEASAAELGTARIVWLGYLDSGMTGWDTNSVDGCLFRADPDDVAAAIAAVLDEEDADILVGYDWHGNYGHPDHIALHRAGRLAIDQARRTPRLFEATNRRESWDEMRNLPEAAEMMASFGFEGGVPDEAWEAIQKGDDGLPMGLPEAEIAWALRLTPEALRRKRAAMACHASQTSDIGMMLSMPPGLYELAFGSEYLVEPGRPGPPSTDWPLPH